MKPLAIDLYAGLGGWAEGLLAAGYDVIGFDIERHEYGQHRYPEPCISVTKCVVLENVAWTTSKRHNWDEVRIAHGHFSNRPDEGRSRRPCYLAVSMRMWQYEKRRDGKSACRRHSIVWLFTFYSRCRQAETRRGVE